MSRRSLLCFLLLAGGSQASAGVPPTHFLQAGFIMHSYDYREEWTPPAKSNESGWVGGLSLRYTYHGRQLPLFARIDLEFIDTRTQYEGGLSMADGSQMDFSAVTKDIFKRLEVNLGWSFNSVGKIPLDLVAYTGFGYRFWRRNLAFGLPADYIEDYSWDYLPLGVRAEYALSQRWSIGLDGAVRFMFGGTMDIMEQFGSPSFSLGSVRGAKVALPVTYRFPGQWTLTLETWYESSGIEESNIVVTQEGQYMYEPSSHTQLFGFTFTAGLQL